MHRALHLHLQVRAAETYEETQVFNARYFVRDILDDPAGVFEHTRR